MVALSPNCINYFVTIMYDKHNEIPSNPLHNECDGVSNHRSLDCLLNCCSGADQWNIKTPPHSLCDGNSPVTKGQYSGKCFRLMTSSCVIGWVWLNTLRGIRKSPLFTHEAFIKRKPVPHHWPFVRGIHRFLSLRVSTPERLCFVWH